MDMKKVIHRGVGILVKVQEDVIAKGLNDSSSFTAEVKGQTYGEKDYVTSIDLAAQEQLIEDFTKLGKKSGFESYAVGEEGFNNSEDEKARMSKGFTWVIDPLDGSNNVVKALKGETDNPSYGSMAALLLDGKPIAGWISRFTRA